jgi:ADP-ribose pyrophosphatase
VGAAAPHLYADAMSLRTFGTLPAHPDVEIGSEQRVWNGRFPLDVVRFRHRRFDNVLSGLKTWEVWRRGLAAAVLPYDPVADVVVLIEQFRLPALAAGLDPVMVELPAGLCDDGEAPEATARRETVEEMGLEIGTLQRIGGFMLSPGGADEVCELYVGRVQAPPADADGIAGHAGMAAEQEDIRVRVWPASRAIEAVLAGEIVNSVAAIGLLWLAVRHAALREEWSKA